MGRESLIKNTSKDSNVHSLRPGYRDIMTLASQIISRSGLAAYMGQSYSGDRDIYEALGYPKNLKYQDFQVRFERQDIARRIIKAPVLASWRQKPVITESEKDETSFEKEWKDLLKNEKIYHYLTRLDWLSGIGQYGVLLLGFADNEDYRMPVEQGKELLFLRPYSENNADISEWDTNLTSPRYGLPEIYTLKPAEADRSKSAEIKVHHSRVLHVAEDCGEDDVYGTPRLQCVYNRLQDLELVSGGSAEMFWRGAFPGLGFNMDKDFQWDNQVMNSLRDEVEEYMHGLKRYLRLQGIDIQQLSPQVADPSKHVSVLLDLISGAVGIPKRILIGSERGELASSQDESNWNSRIDERREDHVEPNILRPFVDKLIDTKILPEPSEEYTVEWPPLTSPDEKEEAEIAKIRTEAIAKYAATPGIDIILPPEIFLKAVMRFTEEQIEEMDQMLSELIADERAQITEERRQLAIERQDSIKKKDQSMLEGEEEDEE